MSSSNLAWLDLAQDPHNVSSVFWSLVAFFNRRRPQKFSLEFSLKADVHFEKQRNSTLPVLKLQSRTTMSELFWRRDDFNAVLKQLDEVFHDDVAKLCAESHFSWNPVSVTLESSE